MLVKIACDKHDTANVCEVNGKRDVLVAAGGSSRGLCLQARPCVVFWCRLSLSWTATFTLFLSRGSGASNSGGGDSGFWRVRAALRIGGDGPEGREEEGTTSPCCLSRLFGRKRNEMPERKGVCERRYVAEVQGRFGRKHVQLVDVCKFCPPCLRPHLRRAAIGVE